MIHIGTIPFTVKWRKVHRQNFNPTFLNQCKQKYIQIRAKKKNLQENDDKYQFLLDQCQLNVLILRYNHTIKSNVYYINSKDSFFYLIIIDRVHDLV